MADPRDTVAFFDYDIEHTCELLAAFLELGGRYRPLVLFAEDSEVGEHPHGFARLKKMGVEVAKVHERKPEAVRQIVLNLRVQRTFSAVNGLREWVDSASHVTLLGGGLQGSIQRRAYDLVRDLRLLPKVNRALFPGPDEKRLMWVKERCHVRRYAHPLFVSGDGRPLLKEALAARPDGQRPLVFSFMGEAESPPERREALDQMREVLRERNLGVQHHFDEDGTPEERVLWIERGKHPALGPGSYLAALQNSIFTLSPAGWSIWTHRSVEALICGSIPILPGPEQYSLDFRDGENCIVVQDENWREALERALALTHADIARMRDNIFDLRDRVLPLDVMTEHVHEAMGLPLVHRETAVSGGS